MPEDREQVLRAAGVIVQPSPGRVRYALPGRGGPLGAAARVTMMLVWVVMIMLIPLAIATHDSRDPFHHSVGEYLVIGLFLAGLLLGWGLLEMGTQRGRQWLEINGDGWKCWWKWGVVTIRGMTGQWPASYLQMEEAGGGLANLVAIGFDGRRWEMLKDREPAVIAALAADLEERLPELANLPCPQCTYNLRGVTHSQCPECGCNLAGCGLWDGQRVGMQVLGKVGPL